MLCPNDQLAHTRPAEHYRQYRQQLTTKGDREKLHAISRLPLARVGQVGGERGMPFGREAGGSSLVGDGRGWRWEVIEEGSEGRRDIQPA